MRVLVGLAGPLIGYTQVSRDAKGLLVGLLASGFIIGVELLVERVPLDAIISAVIGAVIGLVAARLGNWAIFLLDNEPLHLLAQKYSLMTHFILAALGVMIAVQKRSELELLDRDLIVKGGKKKSLTTYLVDTSVLIDGRIADICETKFVAGTLVVPRFILRELQGVADSSDGAKRARGRRGLDILARLQENPEVPVRLFDKDFPEIREVDAKLVALAKDLGARVLTTDFNLNKVASLQGVTVLNVNDLANSLRPVVLPGETMSLFVLKEGKEREQGVAYLDDGTMVVVEEGRRAVGQKVKVSVTSILQTSAGRMIFAKLQKGPLADGPAAGPAEQAAHPDL
ncbi:MAG: TRAM domain-containing protein [Elusimicrobia bacterium]|nr:TRAM domain-containing protein [Elusimicrobiota bacterium]